MDTQQTIFYALRAVRAIPKDARLMSTEGLGSRYKEMERFLVGLEEEARGLYGPGGLKDWLQHDPLTCLYDDESAFAALAVAGKYGLSTDAFISLVTHGGDRVEGIRRELVAGRKVLVVDTAKNEQHLANLRKRMEDYRLSANGAIYVPRRPDIEIINIF